MRSLEDLLDMIPKYLNRDLSDEEMKEFEEGLKTFPILKRETDELQDVKIGIALSDRYAEAHVTPELLTAFVFKPESFSPPEAEKISTHLASCERCQNYHNMTRKSHYYVTRDSLRLRITEQIRVLLERGSAFMQPAPRFAVAALVMVLLAIPAFIGVRELADPSDQVSSWELLTLRERGVAGIDTLSIDNSTTVLRLWLADVPVRLDASYSFSLMDSKDQLVFKLWETFSQRQDAD